MPPKSAMMGKDRKLLSPTESLSQDDTICDAILVDRSEIEEEMERDAKGALEQALQEEGLHVGDVRGELFVGNRCGLSIATRLCTLERQVDEIPSLKNRVSSLEVKNASLEDRVSSLTSSLDAYKLQRNRFISTFKRDKLGNETDRDRRIIGAGDPLVHGGDAVVDAQLYQCRERRDFNSFKKLYGIFPMNIPMISEFFSILKCPRLTD